MLIYSIALVVLLIKNSHQQNIVPERRREQFIAIQTNEILEQVLPLFRRYLENERAANTRKHEHVKTTLGVLQTELQATKRELHEIKTQSTKHEVTEPSTTNEDQSSACDHTQIQCRESTLCIPHSWLCDGDDDCGDNSDEENCNHDQSSACDHTQIQCRESTLCIPNGWLCDGDDDCGDNSDEENCNHG